MIVGSRSQGNIDNVVDSVNTTATSRPFLNASPTLTAMLGFFIVFRVPESKVYELGRILCTSLDKVEVPLRRIRRVGS